MEGHLHNSTCWKRSLKVSSMSLYVLSSLGLVSVVGINGRGSGSVSWWHVILGDELCLVIWCLKWWPPSSTLTGIAGIVAQRPLFFCPCRRRWRWRSGVTLRRLFAKTASPAATRHLICCLLLPSYRRQCGKMSYRGPASGERDSCQYSNGVTWRDGYP